MNFSFGEEGRAQEVESRDHPFAKEHDWEASRYAGCFVYWPTLIARWRWLELVMGHFGAGWRIFAVFLLMAGLDIRSIEQLKHVRAQEAARVLGLARLGAKTQIWEWFYTVARQGLAKELLGDYCRYQIRAGLVGVWIWFTDGHLLPYTGKEKVHYSYNTQRRMPVPGRTNQVTCDGSGRIVDFQIEEGKGKMKQWIRRCGRQMAAGAAGAPGGGVRPGRVRRGLFLPPGQRWQAVRKLGEEPGCTTAGRHRGAALRHGFHLQRQAIQRLRAAQGILLHR